MALFKIRTLDTAEIAALTAVKERAERADNLAEYRAELAEVTADTWFTVPVSDDPAQDSAPTMRRRIRVVLQERGLDADFLRVNKATHMMPVHVVIYTAERRAKDEADAADAEAKRLARKNNGTGEVVTTGKRRAVAV